MITWKALSGRVVLFPTQPATQSANALFRQIWGTDPDSFQKSANPFSPAVAQGRRGGMMVNCLVQQVQPRIDFNLMPVPKRQGELALALIADTGELHASLARITRALDGAADSTVVSRVALAVQFICEVKNSGEANGVLTKTIPERYGVTLADEEDFIFQINRPYKSLQIENIKMNSLVKWSMERLRVMSIAVPSQISAVHGQADISLPSPQVKDFVAASVNFDINNVPSQTPLTGAQQSSILIEALGVVERTQRDIGLNIEGF